MIPPFVLGIVSTRARVSRQPLINPCLPWLCIGSRCRCHWVRRLTTVPGLIKSANGYFARNLDASVCPDITNALYAMWTLCEPRDHEVRRARIFAKFVTNADLNHDNNACPPKISGRIVAQSGGLYRTVGTIMVSGHKTIFWKPKSMWHSVSASVSLPRNAIVELVRSQ